MSVWPFLMGFSAYLAIGGWLVGNGNTLRMGGAILTAYALMQLKKIGFSPEYQHAISMLIWCSAASYIASTALNRGSDYGIPPIPLMVALLLVLTGTCYLWDALIGAKSGIGIPHSIISDLLAIAAMLLVGRGLGGELWSYLRELGSLGAPSGRGG